VELVPFQASPSTFGGPHLFGKCGTLAYAFRDAEAIALLRAAALKNGNGDESLTDRSPSQRRNVS